MQSKSYATATINTPASSPHQWVENYADYLYNYAISRINDPEQAKDLVQETFLAALQQVEKFEARSSERTWLTAILKNKIIDVYRKKASGLAGRTQHIGLDDQTIEFFETENGHWKAAHQPVFFGMEDFDPFTNKEFNEILKTCMQKLPALWLAIFTMKHLDDEDTAIICRELKVTAANFWVIMHRSKVNLRACLEKNWI